MKPLPNQMFYRNDGKKMDKTSVNPRTNLRKSTRPRLRETMQGRLDELTVMEITLQERKYYHFNIRGLYNHVLKKIAKLSVSPHKGQQRRRASLNLEATDLKEQQQPKSRNDSSDQSQSSSISVNDDEGQHFQTSREKTYGKRLGGHLHPRDMRRLVTPFSLSNEPELIVRRHVMLLNFDPLRAIILRDRLLLLVPDGADSLLETIEKRLRGGATGEENDLFGEPPNNPPVSSDMADTEKHHFLPREDATVTRSTSDLLIRESHNDEFDELKNRTWINLPFELQCVDAVLHGVTGMLTDQARDTQKEALSSMEYLLSPDTGTGAFSQEVLRTTKNSVRTMRSRVKGFVRALTLVLNEDEDMALMNLSRLVSHPGLFIQPVPAHVLEEESDEPELILETYLQMGVTLTNELEWTKGHLRSTEELLHMKSDTLQNRILFVNMLTAVFATVISMALLISGFFGMNVPVYMYEGKNGFYFTPIVIGSIGGSFLLMIVVLLMLRRGGIFNTAA